VVAVSTAAQALDRESDIAQEAIDQVRSRLPAGWTVAVQSQSALFGPDAVVALEAPGGTRAILVVEVKKSLVTRELASILEQLNGFIANGLLGQQKPKTTPVPMIVARYIPEPLQVWMRERAVSYADATGNVWLSVERPALFLRDVGATNDPWRGPGRPKGNLTGEPAARVVRALVDFRPPYSIPKLIELAGTSSGATYRVIEFLEDQALLTRETRGPIVEVQWRALLDRWAKDYGFTRTNTITRCLAARGIPDLVSRLGRGELSPGSRYALTGTLAAQQWAPYAPARNAMIYTDAVPTLMEALSLREADTAANVLVASSPYDVAFLRTTEQDGLVTVAPSQAAVDLLTGPGRNPAEAEELLDWMEANEDAWRR
jgi:hypothetical protein